MTDTQHEATERVSDERVEVLRSGCLTRVRVGVSSAIDFERDIASALTELLALRAHDAGQAGVVVKPLFGHDTPKQGDADFDAKFKYSKGWLKNLRQMGLDAGGLYVGSLAVEAADLLAALSTSPAEPKPSLSGDALAAAGQSIGMSVTRVHPEPGKVGEEQRQYYYRVTGCNAREADAPDCICWHNEGTGPLVNDPDLIRNWRPAPATPPVADARRVEEWQDISTAPMDGTPILIIRPTRFPAEEMYHVVRWERDGGWTEGFWAVHDGKNDHPLRGAEPTLWMPLQVEAPLRALKGDSNGH